MEAVSANVATSLIEKKQSSSDRAGSQRQDLQGVKTKRKALRPWPPTGTSCSKQSLYKPTVGKVGSLCGLASSCKPHVGGPALHITGGVVPRCAK
jgi:hypothetical protein